MTKMLSNRERMARKMFRAGDRVQTLRHGVGTVKDAYSIAGVEYVDVWLDNYRRDHHPYVAAVCDVVPA